MTHHIPALLGQVDGWDHGHMDWGGGWWMLLWGTAMMAGVALVVVWAVRMLVNGPTAPGSRGDDPLTSARRILAERYARGELSSVEYRERLTELDRP